MTIVAAEEPWEAVERPEDDGYEGTQSMNLPPTTLSGDPASTPPSSGVDRLAQSTPAAVKRSVPASSTGPPIYSAEPEPAPPKMCNELQLGVKTNLPSPFANDDAAAEETLAVPGTPRTDLVSIAVTSQEHVSNESREEVQQRASNDVVGFPSVPRGSGRFFGKLAEKRMVVLGLRARLRESRNDLRFRRDDLIDQDTALIQHINLFESNVSNAPSPIVLAHEKLLQLLDASKAAREDLQQLGIEHNHLEDQLDRQEWELKELEERAYESYEARDFWAAGRNSDAASVFSESPSTTLKSDPGDSCNHNFQAYLTQRYLSRNGDADMIEEKIHLLRIDRAQLHEEERIRLRLGRDLAVEARDFLASFDTRHEELQRDLQRVREDIFEMKSDILNQDDALFRSDHLDEELARVEGLPEDDILCDFEWAPHPLLLKNDDFDPKFSSVTSEVNDMNAQMACFVNLWLYLILRHSLVEIRLFLNIFEFKFPSIRLTSDIITHFVQHWTKDVAAQTGQIGQGVEQKPMSLLLRHSAENFTTRSLGSHSVFTNGDRLRSRLAGLQNPAAQSTESMVRKLMAGSLTHARSKSF